MKLIRWLVTISYAGLIFYMSSRTWPQEAFRFFPNEDKVIHFGIYFVLGGLVMWTLRVTSLKGRHALWIMAAALAAIYGATDELHQSFVPGRSMDIFDWFMDALGAVAGAYTAAWIARKFKDAKTVQIENASG